MYVPVNLTYWANKEPALFCYVIWVHRTPFGLFRQRTVLLWQWPNTRIDMSKCCPLMVQSIANKISCFPVICLVSEIKIFFDFHDLS